MIDGREPRGRPPGPLAGVALGAALGVAVFLLAALVHDHYSRGTPEVRLPEGFAAGGDARGAVRVLRGSPAPGVEAVLLPLREDGAPAEAGERILDAALFPGGPPRRWRRLLVAAGPEAAPFRLSLAPGAVTLEDGGQQAGNEDLAAAVRARAPALSAHRLLDLRVHRADAASIPVEPGTAVRVLLAFPAGASPGETTGATLAGGGRLLPVEVTTESLRAALLEGRPGALREARTAEVGGVPAPGAGGRAGERRR